jgi:hypothetical protein
MNPEEELDSRKLRSERNRNCKLQQRHPANNERTIERKRHNRQLDCCGDHHHGGEKPSHAVAAE